MVEKQDNTELSDEDITVDEETTPLDDPELEEVEAHSDAKLKKLRAAVKDCEEQKRAIHEELQRTKADFLNAKRRLEEERARGEERLTNKFAESLLPLCDSFHMAMADTKLWEQVDEKWRKGVEGIRAQLETTLQRYHVTVIDPTGTAFDPNLHEAMGELPVEDKDKDHTVVSVIQPGYQIVHGEKSELLRPARVMVGVYNE